MKNINHVGINLKPLLLIKGGYYIVPSPSTALICIIYAAICLLHNKAALPGKTQCTFLRRVVKSPISNLEILALIPVTVFPHIVSALE
jgi:hypothetical protein